ncbi:MAG: hypothetical protein ACRC7D_12915 [Aeromonas popoffii]|nr:hypothetical protein [Aeromonas sp.]
MSRRLPLGPAKQESQHPFAYRQKLKRQPGSATLSLPDRIGPA